MKTTKVMAAIITTALQFTDDENSDGCGMDKFSGQGEELCAHREKVNNKQCTCIYFHQSWHFRHNL